MISDRCDYGNRERNHGQPVDVVFRDVRTCLRAGFVAVDCSKERAKKLAEAGVVDREEDLLPNVVKPKAKAKG